MSVALARQMMWRMLGAGADTFVGSDTDETVYAGPGLGGGTTDTEHPRDHLERHLHGDPPTEPEVAACVGDIEAHLDDAPALLELARADRDGERAVRHRRTARHRGDPGERRPQVLVDVDGQGPQRRDVQHTRALLGIGRLGAKSAEIGVEVVFVDDERETNFRMRTF